MSTTDLYLSVPQMLSLGQRRNSEGGLNSNDLLSQGSDSLMDSAGLGSSHPNLNSTGRRETNPSIFDEHLVDAFRKHYEIAPYCPVSDNFEVSDFEKIGQGFDSPSMA
ncbi:Protein CBG13918 [Caenorhabditis briggsae]|uniref:Protein CBG13918 n=1 Tax=Caenorhabditis briggsae TaxID=6238 RepID=A8XJ14_CAEBR|nr:Protein CBG13918 [Caenorhabditis briggsae]CAP32641.2 Protein CBG13918 [Caenorhabditis briggsae]